MVSPFGSPRRSSVAEAGYWVRLLWFPIACLVVMVLALLQSGRASSAVDERPRVDNVAPTTPVWSARRVPNLLALPAQAAALQGPVLAAMDGIPLETSCASVTNARGLPVFQHNATKVLSPASNEKVLLAFGSLTQFPADRTFTTSVATDAQILNGSVQGNIWLVGGGDPVLATEDYVNSFVEQQRVFSRFESLVDQIQAAGITRVKGNVVADASRYDDVLYHPNWPSRFASGGVSGPIAALAVNNGFAAFSPGGQTMAGSGAASSDPPRNAAGTLIDLLEARGIAVDGRADAGVVPPSTTSLAQLQSPPLRAIVGQMLSTSDNTIAEMLFKELGVARAGKGSFEGGAAALTAILTEKGLAFPGMVISDGSGLDLANQVPCATLNGVLDAAGGSSDLAAGLAVAGRSGTLKNRMVDTPAAGNVRGKTGTLDSVTSLSGFVQTSKGETVSFAIIVNAAGAEEYKDIEERFVLALTDHPGGPDVAQLLPLP